MPNEPTESQPQPLRLGTHGAPERILTKPTTMAATYMNYAAELIVKANQTEGKERNRLLAFAAKWRQAAERELDKAARQRGRIK
jgi:hypothetical protein